MNRMYPDLPPPRRVRRALLGSLALLGGLALVGCAAPGPGDAGGSAPASAPATGGPEPAAAEDQSGFISVFRESGITVEQLPALPIARLEVSAPEGWATSTEDLPGGALALSNGPLGGGSVNPSLVSWAFLLPETAGDAPTEEDLADALRGAFPGEEPEVSVDAGVAPAIRLAWSQPVGELELSNILFGHVITHEEDRYLLLSQLAADSADLDAIGPALEQLLPGGLSFDSP